MTLLLFLALTTAAPRCINNCLADIHVIRHGVKHDTPVLPAPSTEVEYRRPRDILTPAKAHRRWYKKRGLIPRINRLC